MPSFEDPEIYRDILDGLQIGVSVLNLQRKIVFWSDGAEQITGYSRIDVLGHSCVENILLHCNQKSCETCSGNCPLAAALHDARPVEAISSIHHKSGHWAPVHTWAIPLRDKHGSIIAIIQTFEREFTVNGPSPNDRSMKARGCLDYATELPNHAMMQSHLRETLATFAELQIPLGVVFLEVTNLQQFQARYGHEAGANMLRVLARTLRNSVWPTDFVGRWSDDRFLLLLSGCDQDALPAVGARMLQMTARATIEWWGEELSAAVVMGCTSALTGDSPESLLQRTQDELDRSRSTASARAAANAGSSSSH
jgi:diguanylate cyclase (GGDEF)-like protein/PAS domain S-box-containing protein